MDHQQPHPPQAPMARRLSTRLLMLTQEAVDAASCAAAVARASCPYSSINFVWNGAGYTGWVRDDRRGWIQFDRAGVLAAAHT